MGIIKNQRKVIYRRRSNRVIEGTRVYGVYMVTEEVDMNVRFGYKVLCDISRIVSRTEYHPINYLLQVY